jgi:hypothetical protein
LGFGTFSWFLSPTSSRCLAFSVNLTEFLSDFDIVFGRDEPLRDRPSFWCIDRNINLAQISLQDNRNETPCQFRWMLSLHLVRHIHQPLKNISFIRRRTLLARLFNCLTVPSERDSANGGTGTMILAARISNSSRGSVRTIISLLHMVEGI